ncbi:hypothetical protein [Candidatus Contubernalis alkaliaceticus]|uniref:hypothetical protein n=1 Tax=Candidatus Contubernalis alkaliaceticus TaxID=338645 RepID=UPI001F4C433B|nr:hypothetical protein [Candidatus Contubernalis alkalaceticus]UNC91667.1 hypothetical protein HUE98_05910 [Candidatus Contubernalis alkalaceticus]
MASKCQTCQHYQYHAGVAPSIAKMIGKPMPSRPTCYCHHAGVRWERRSAEVRKPRGISCDYKIREMSCEDCGKQLKRSSDIWMVITPKVYICKKCGKKKAAEMDL